MHHPTLVQSGILSLFVWAWEERRVGSHEEAARGHGPLLLQVVVLIGGWGEV